ncbi:MAG: imidazole glycerol phosphate synthase subunit HisH [Myxococcaceae bacterium]|nr:imidazole glycerol phosphate synthase subunit HisH [Myxococcaceae bacterium]
MTREIVVVDYGSGNVRSIVNALLQSREPGQDVVLSADPARLLGAERAVLPGVGAFNEVRRKLDASGLLPAIEQFRSSGRPFLGVCVGMQILATKGLEFGDTPGLGWIPGEVRQLEVPPSLKIPHFGWSKVTPRAGSPLFAGLPASPQFYFVHSFAFSVADPQAVEATADYGGPFTAAVRVKNVFGTQFHPEKSDVAGLALLSNFCRWNPT